MMFVDGVNGFRNTPFGFRFQSASPEGCFLLTFGGLKASLRIEYLVSSLCNWRVVIPAVSAARLTRP